jgi:tetratricopeptide (TPR) repeat protein
MPGPAPRRRKKKTVRVFIASPGDLASERRSFKQQIDELNAGFGDGAGVEYVPVGWEDTLASTGRRVQSVINQDVDTCDVFVLAMYRRWGQPAPDSSYSSYTEEEFQRALQRLEKTGRPEIFVFFKQVDEASVADAGPELSKVLKFRRELENTRTVRWRLFNDPAEFGREIDGHLRAFSQGRLPKVPVERARLPLPVELVERVERAEAEARRLAEEAEARAKRERHVAKAAAQRAAAQEARAAALESLLATKSATAAGEGSVEHARQLFANATAGTANPQVLNLAFEFYWRTGLLDAAEDMLKRWLAATGTAPTGETAVALGNLGLIHHTRGDLEQAEKVFRQALAIDTRLHRHDAISHDVTNLGLLCQTRGDLDEAEKLFRQALAVEKRLGRRQGQSDRHTLLALVEHARGKHERAADLHAKALSLYRPAGAAPPSGIVTIPVVVHVVYKTTAENISDKQIASQIAVLNGDFRARNADLSAVPYPFRRAVGDARIHFALARKAPGGQPTTGITRTRTSRASFGSDDEVKRIATGGIDPWDTSRYLNIWVCNLTGGLMGYGQFPGGKPETDGAVVIGSAFGTMDSATPFKAGRTATHTVGHNLGLRHLWDEGMALADVPKQKSPNFGVPTFPHVSDNNGPHGDMFMNFMDYVDDAAMHMFTKGQVLEMQEVLAGARAGLVGRRSAARRVPRAPGRNRAARPRPSR